MPWAMERQIGTISAVVAVLDMKFVMIQQRINTTKVSTYGEGFSPNAPITVSAIMAPAPVWDNADARDKVPPNRKMVFKSIDFSASFSEITPVTIRASAPTHPEMHSLMPIFFSKIMASRVSTRITRDKVCFHFGTSSKFLVVSKAPPSPLTFLFGRNR